MKLSEKLAALEHEAAAEAAPARARATQGTARPRTRTARTTDGRERAGEEAGRKVRELVLAELAPRVAGLSPDELAGEVRTTVDRILRRGDVHVSPLERKRVTQEVLQDTLGYGPLDPLLADPTITEIMCNSHREIWVERDGLIGATDAAFRDEAHYRSVIERIVSAVGRRVDESSPMVDARLPDGSRVNAIIPPLAIRGPALTIRKFSAEPYTAADLVRFGTLPIDLVVVLEAAVRGRLNVLVSGGTGTGKTTVLNVLSSFIPEGERIVTIEDAAELRLQQAHVVPLEARPANAEGAGEVPIRQLVRNALRMRPDRIVVGECRGPEALDMLQAMNTGHEGSLTTVHANTPRDALRRLETMVLMAGFDLPLRAIREQIAAALDVIVHLERRPGGRRQVVTVTEVQGLEGDTFLLQDVFAFERVVAQDGQPDGELVPTGLRPRFVERLAAAGITLPDRTFAPRRAAPRAIVAGRRLEGAA